MDFFYDQESKDGIRLPWNNLPANHGLQQKYAVPTSLHLALSCASEPIVVQPQRCQCRAIISPQHIIDIRSSSWLCPFCSRRNRLAQLRSKQNVFSTFTYLLPCNNPIPPVLLLIDLAVPFQEFEALKKQIQSVLDSLWISQPLGLITFGKCVSIYDLSTAIITKTVLPSKVFSTARVCEVLYLTSTDPRKTAADAKNRFFPSKPEAREKLKAIIKGLKPQTQSVVTSRLERSTGAALNLALSILELVQNSANIMLFLSGPCTKGPGQVAQIEMQSIMRSFDDLKSFQNTKFYQKSKKFYEQLTVRAVKKLITVNAMVYTLDQFGLIEMSSLISSTGGMIVMGEQFMSSIFRQNLKRIFHQRQQPLFSNQGVVQVFLSSELKVNGALGSCAALERKATWVSPREVGVGKTMSWFVGNISESRSLTFILQPDYKGLTGKGVMQFQVMYRFSQTQYALRVTTIVRHFAPLQGLSQNYNALTSRFDQEAALLTLARLSSLKFQQNPGKQVIKWLDRNLIKVSSFFGNYQKNNPQSFKLPKEMKLLPQFVYHLRRSNLVNCFGMSPDQQHYYHLSLMRQSVSNCLLMVQPSLYQYSVDDPTPHPVRLQSTSMKEDVILLLDTYYAVVLWHGNSIHSWKQQNLHQQEQYQYLQQLFNSPNEDITQIRETRVPMPMFYQTWSGHPKERILKSKVIPELGIKEEQVNQNLYSDEISLRMFTEYLVKVAVKQ